MSVALFIGIYVARYLGPEDFGLLNYVASFVGLFIIASSMGLDEIIVRELVNNPEKRNQLLGTSFLLKIMGVLITWLILLVVVLTTDIISKEHSLITFIALSAIFQTTNVIEFNYQAEVKSKSIVTVQIIQLIISSIVKLILISLDANLIWFAVIYCLDAAILAIGLILVYSRQTGRIFRWEWNQFLAKKLLKDSWPLLLTGMVISIYMRIDQIMIKEIIGDREVGLYVAAVKLSESWYFIPVAITAALFPAIISAKNKSEALYYARLQKLYNLMVKMAILIAIPTTFISPTVILYLYGTPYIEAGSILTIHIWSGVFVFLSMATGKWFISENISKLLFKNILLGAITNILLNSILISKYGANGAAISTFISQLLSSYILLYFNKKTRKTFYMQTRAILNIFKIS